MSCATRVANNNLINNFYGETFLCVQGRVRSWSLVSLITYYKKFAEKLLAIRSKKGREGKMKKKRTRMAIAKVFALNANAIYIWSLTSIISLWMSAAFLGMS